MGHSDVRNLLLRSVRYLAGDSIPVETNAPESVHIGLTRSLQAPGEYIFSLVNTTSGPVRPLRGLLPVHDISVRLNLEGEFSNYKILRSGEGAKVSYDNGGVNIRLSKLNDFFAVHLVMMS
jgi:hypothetical protein